MCSTMRRRKYRKPHWKYVELRERDIRLFKLILEQKFLRRREVMDYVFDGMKSYAEFRIRKLKNFEYIKAIQVLKIFKFPNPEFSVTFHSVKNIKILST